MKKREGSMFYIKKTPSTGRYEINLFGLKMKFRIHDKDEKLKNKIANMYYELADPRTLASIKLPRVLNAHDALYTLTSCEKSMARCGDGEFKLIMGENISFQKYDPVLAERLKNILTNKNENMLVGLPDVFGYCNHDYLRKVLVQSRDTLYKYFDFSKSYIDTNVTRQMIFVNEQQGNDYYARMKSLWHDKEVVIVEGAGSRLGVGNDLFDGATSIHRIICPIKDAFSKYDEILVECLRQPKHKLFIIALGPTATVLAEDLCNEGYRALDIGHLDTAYEAFLRKSNVFVHVEGKIVFNEERKENKIPECKDENYNKQIIKMLVD